MVEYFSIKLIWPKGMAVVTWIGVDVRSFELDDGFAAVRWSDLGRTSIKVTLVTFSFLDLIINVTSFSILL